ncbi:hypothetical protein B0H34DRAFT_510466 [Crassisporium funariophilum]|nr:hypothetical protein B0H34DRAFT_510466 [Crassisporium funariophilum]
MAVRYRYTMDDTGLRVWYVSQVIIAALSVLALDVVSMARVYALYNQQRWMGILLVSMLLMEIILAFIGLGLNLPDENFDPTTITTHLPMSFAYFGISAVVVQSFILALIMIKYGHGHLKGVPLVKLMMRDGTFAFLMLTVFALTVVVYTLRSVVYAVTGYAWLLTGISCVTCRLIINMQRLPLSEENTHDSTTIQFTSIFTDQIAMEVF